VTPRFAHWAFAYVIVKNWIL